MPLTISPATKYQTVEGCGVFMPFDGNCPAGGIAPDLTDPQASWLFDSTSVDGSGNATGIGASIAHCGTIGIAPGVRNLLWTPAQFASVFAILDRYGAKSIGWFDDNSFYQGGWTLANMQSMVDTAFQAVRDLKAATGRTYDTHVFGGEPDYFTGGWTFTQAQLLQWVQTFAAKKAALVGGDVALLPKYAAWDYGGWDVGPGGHFAPLIAGVAASDAASAAALSAWSVHGYDNNVQRVGAVLDTIGRPMWQTEISHDTSGMGRLIGGAGSVPDTGNTTMVSALTFARFYARCFLTNHSMITAFCAWNQGAGGMVDRLTLSQEYGARPTTKRFWGAGNYLRFVRPGAQMVDVAGNPAIPTSNDAALASAPYATAFVNPDGKIVVVAVNEGASAAELDFSFASGTPAQLYPWITDATRNLQQQAAPIAPSGSSFAYMMPAQSIVTFTVDPGTVVTTTTAAPTTTSTTTTTHAPTTTTTTAAPTTTTTAAPTTTTTTTAAPTTTTTPAPATTPPPPIQAIRFAPGALATNDVNGEFRVKTSRGIVALKLGGPTETPIRVATSLGVKSIR